MKEFINKLIERLEEIKNAKVMKSDGKPYGRMTQLWRIFGINEAIEIANKLAEEYNVEICGFKHGVIGTDKMPADTTLNKMKKSHLIKLLHTAQHNYEALIRFHNNAVIAHFSQLNNNGWIPCSGCKDCQHKECKHHGKV